MPTANMNLIFKTAGQKTMSITIPKPLSGIDADQALTKMDDLIELEVVGTEENGLITEPLHAAIITTQVTDMI